MTLPRATLIALMFLSAADGDVARVAGYGLLLVVLFVFRPNPDSALR